MLKEISYHSQISKRILVVKAAFCRREVVSAALVLDIDGLWDCLPINTLCRTPEIRSSTGYLQTPTVWHTHALENVFNRIHLLYVAQQMRKASIKDQRPKKNCIQWFRAQTDMSKTLCPRWWWWWWFNKNCTTQCSVFLFGTEISMKAPIDWSKK